MTGRQKVRRGWGPGVKGWGGRILRLLMKRSIPLNLGVTKGPCLPDGPDPMGDRLKKLN